MKKLFALLALLLFIGGFSATAIASSMDAPVIELQADDDKKVDKKDAPKKTETKDDCAKEAKSDCTKEAKSDCSKECQKKGDKKSTGDSKTS